MTDQEGAPASGDKVVHVYDDIQEEDNRLPNWWLAILFGTILFSFGYWYVYHTTHTLPLPSDAYKAEVAALIAERISKNPMSDEALVALSHDPAAVGAGHEVFTTMCVSCHGKNAEGNIGPNLTDRFWIHGGKPADVLRSLTDGYPEKGMPKWGMILGDTKTRNVTAYVLSVRNTNQPSTKPPQGTEED